jgi:tetratricopeptide (TPR) repeat protein
VNRTTDRLVTPDWIRLVPAGLTSAILILAIWFDGAFDVRYWAPLGLLALAVLCTMLISGGLRLPRSPALRTALAAIWGFAAWCLLSALWADSANQALVGGLRTVLYAALATVAATSLSRPGDRRAIAYGLVGGVGLIAVVTLLDVRFDGEDSFLAGRLNEPIGYRNASAAVLAFATWPLIGLAAQRGLNSLVRVASFAGTVLVLGLILTTQSRGVLIGLALGGLVSLAIGPDRLRRFWIAAAAVVPVAIASGTLLEPYHLFTDGLTVTAESIEDTGNALLLMTLAAALAAIPAVVLDNGQRPAPGFDRVARRIAAAGVALVVAVGLVGGLVAIGNPIDYADEKIEEFKDIDPDAPTGTTRLGSVGGQRYDLWRIALDEWADNPIAGAGEGSYPFAYYEERRTDRNIADVHSLPMRVLAETGLIGALLFGAFLIAIGIRIARNASRGVLDDRRWIAAATAGATTIFAQTLTDWLWLLPGLMGIGFVALGLAAAEEEEPETEPRHVPRPARAGVAALLVVAICATVLLYLSDLYVRKARFEAVADPGQSLEYARTAADLNPTAITPLFLQASALETQGDREAARAALDDALDKEPNNFVTLALLGDLEVRDGDPEAARAYYEEALALNPRDVGLRELVRNPG